MSDTKFTKGPWGKDGLSVRTMNGVICTAPLPQKGGCFDIQDNLNLISAAPDLYEAANEARELLLGGWTTRDGYEFHHADVLSALDKIRAALAKAGQP